MNNGVQGPLNQRPDFVEAKRLHDVHVKETSEGNTPIHPIEQDNEETNSSKDWKTFDYQVDPRTSSEMLFSLVGNLNPVAIDGECRQIHLPHATCSHAQSFAQH